METGIKSKEARKYIFNCLDDMAQVSIELLSKKNAFDPEQNYFLLVLHREG